MPYISASIIMNLLQAMSPALKDLKKEGKSGQEKIAKYTIQGTLVLAAFQSLGISVALEAQPGLVLDPGLLFRITAMLTLVTGTMFLVWLGTQITSRGIGNGISMIIFAGIVAGLPSALGNTFELTRTGDSSIPLVFFLIAAGVLVTARVVFV
jgi:preprotein translocase subunit SecY